MVVLRRFISKDTDDFIQSEQYYTQPILILSEADLLPRGEKDLINNGIKQYPEQGLLIKSSSRLNHLLWVADLLIQTG